MNQTLENLLKKYHTARIDIKNYGNSNNRIIILENNDPDSQVSEPRWFIDYTGKGTKITSSEGILDLKIKCVNWERECF